MPGQRVAPVNIIGENLYTSSTASGCFKFSPIGDERLWQPSGKTADQCALCRKIPSEKLTN